MIEKTPMEVIPIVKELSWATNKITLGDDLQMTVISGSLSPLPEYFQTAAFALNLLVSGKATVSINQRQFVIEAPGFSAIMVNHIIKVINSTDDVEQYTLSFSPKFASDLHLHFTSEAHMRAYVRPVFDLTDEQMHVTKNFFLLLREVILSPGISNAREVAIGIVRSLIYYIYGFYDKSFSKVHTLSRSEELVGRFLALVELHSHEHHTINWYASEMCLSLKYIAYVVKKVTGKTAGDCINENLMRQAKSLLLSTSLTVQQISDQLGYHNQSHFGTFFRRYTGISPQAFRRQA